MATCVLAGDIGGTKTNLAVYAVTGHGELALVHEASYDSHAFARLETVVEQFLHAEPERIAGAAFGIAGPVIGGMVQVTNLPWRVEARALGRAIGCPSVRLMNDLETTAYGALFLDAGELLTLNAGEQRPGNRAVIAAGTGLGQALLIWDGKRYQTAATEGGHVDFGPRDEREIELLRFLRQRYGRVSWERVLSGPGLHNIFRFLDEGQHRPVADAMRVRLATADDASAVIGEAGVAGTCATCVEAVEIFVSLYGAQAGNLGLDALAVGGVYVGGGIVTKLLPLITRGAFVAAFTAKEPHRALLERMPLYVMLNPKASQLGAAHAAVDLVAGDS